MFVFLLQRSQTPSSRQNRRYLDAERSHCTLCRKILCAGRGVTQQNMAKIQSLQRPTLTVPGESPPRHRTCKTAAFPHMVHPLAVHPWRTLRTQVSSFSQMYDRLSVLSRRGRLCRIDMVGLSIVVIPKFRISSSSTGSVSSHLGALIVYDRCITQRRSGVCQSHRPDVISEDGLSSQRTQARPKKAMQQRSGGDAMTSSQEQARSPYRVSLEAVDVARAKIGKSFPHFCWPSGQYGNTFPMLMLEVHPYHTGPSFDLHHRHSLT
jgi:hypothetical protein